MSENLFKTSCPGAKKQKPVSRKVALSVINGEISSRKRITKLKQNGKTQKLEKFAHPPVAHLAHPYLPEAPKFQIFEDVDSENTVSNRYVDKENVAKSKDIVTKNVGDQSNGKENRANRRNVDRKNAESRKDGDSKHAVSNKDVERKNVFSLRDAVKKNVVNIKDIDRRNRVDENVVDRENGGEHTYVGNENAVNCKDDLFITADETSSLPPSPECIGLSPEIQKETFFSYSKKKKEKESSDFIWCTPYRQDIHIYFKEIEQNFQPNPDYMEKQQDLNMQMRRILVDWCIEVVEEYNLHRDTLYLAVSYVDRFLSRVSVLRGKLQLVGTSSLFLAAKYEEIYPPELKDFVFITDNTYSKQQILRMEHVILKVLNFDLSLPTAYTFLELYLSMCNASNGHKHLAKYICEISLLDGDPFLKYLPSVTAAAALALSNYILGYEMWDESWEGITGYKLTDLYHLCQLLFDRLKKMPTCTERAVHGKYSSTKYGCAALMPISDKLIFPNLVTECSCAYC